MTVLCFFWDGKCCLWYPTVTEKPQERYGVKFGQEPSAVTCSGSARAAAVLLLLSLLHLIPHTQQAVHFFVRPILLSMSYLLEESDHLSQIVISPQRVLFSKIKMPYVLDVSIHHFLDSSTKWLPSLSQIHTLEIYQFDVLVNNPSWNERSPVKIAFMFASLSASCLELLSILTVFCDVPKSETHFASLVRVFKLTVTKDRGVRSLQWLP